VIVGLLLAAGQSRRFGAQKLVASYAGSTIVRVAAERLLASPVGRVIVVTGSDALAVRDALATLSVTFVHNQRFADGLSSSLIAGIGALGTDVDAVVVALGDQPGTDPEVVRTLIARYRSSGRAIVAPRYEGGVRGNPVLLDRRVFPELMALTGDVGARALIDGDPDRVELVAVPVTPPPDVDTPEDLRAAVDAS
jgi:molybdenum cofactor cytidylyltransferase